MKDDMIFSKKLKTLRKEKGLTQAELAKKLEIARSTIANYEVGSIYPSYEMMLSLSKLFGVSVDYLTGESQYRTIAEKFDAEYDTEKLARESKELSEADQKDVANKLEGILSELQSAQSGLMFMGNELDDNTRELLVKSLENSLLMGKVISNKKK